MLENLRKIDWKQHGDERIPDWIEQLTSDNEEIRAGAYHLIEDNVLYANQDWENVERGIGVSAILNSDVPYLMIPFLIELLNSDKIEDKEKIVSILHFMVDLTNFADDGLIYKQRAKSIYDAIWDEKVTFFELLNNGSNLAKIESVHILSAYPEHITDTLSLLLPKIEVETSEDTKLHMIWAISINMVENENYPNDAITEFKTFVKHIALSEKRHIISTLCAMILLNADRENTAQGFIDIIVENLVQDTQQLLPTDPPILRPPSQINALAKLGTQIGVQSAIRVIKNTTSLTNAMYSIMIGLMLAFTPQDIPRFWDKGILEFTFSHQYAPVVDSSSLTNLQKEILETIYVTSWIWNNQSNILDIFELPKDRTKFKKLLDNRS